jgi:hypothetical protein
LRGRGGWGPLRQTAVKSGCLTFLVSQPTMITTIRPAYVLKEKP